MNHYVQCVYNFPFALFYPFIHPLVKQKQQLAYDTTVHSVRAVAGVEQGSDDWRGRNRGIKLLVLIVLH